MLADGGVIVIRLFQYIELKINLKKKKSVHSFISISSLFNVISYHVIFYHLKYSKV